MPRKTKRQKMLEAQEVAQQKGEFIKDIGFIIPPRDEYAAGSFVQDIQKIYKRKK